MKLYLLTTAVLLQSCGNLLWENKNTLILETPNNSKTQKLILFIKEGGATVGSSYQISALPINTKFKDTTIGNLFIADDHDGLIAEDTGRIKLKWIGNDTALVSFDPKLRVFKSEVKFGGLIVMYDTTSFQNKEVQNK